MKKISFEFNNSNGEILAGLLELPEHPGGVRGYALFAHCFTCGKDTAAASRISRALTARGIGVLRFDFTGLGNSDGDFANTNFTTNIDDLVLAAEALGSQYQAPQILIGHSLGGAAVLAAAARLESTRAVVTIAAPAMAQHISHLFRDESDLTREQGEAVVALGAREFRIKRQFLQDIEHYTDTDQISRLDAALQNIQRVLFHWIRPITCLAMRQTRSMSPARLRPGQAATWISLARKRRPKLPAWRPARC